MTGLARAWNSMGRRTGLALIVVGVAVVAEAVLSHVYRIGWSGEYGAHRLLALALGAAAIVCGAIRLAQTWSGLPTEQEIAAFARRWLPFALAGVIYFLACLIAAPVPEGDQPHYELESVGLAYEQTRDMTKDYSLPERYRLMFPLGVTDIHAAHYKRGGEFVAVQNVGLPLLLAPALPVIKEIQVLSPGRELWPWHIEIILMAALAAQLLYGILRRLRPSRPGLVACVWGATVFSAPLVIYASQVYPEIPAMLLALIAVDALTRPATRGTIVLGASAAALMPWMHVRFLPISVVLAAGFALRAIGTLHSEDRDRRAALGRSAWAIVPLAVSLILMAIAFQRWYGSPSPTAQYRLPSTRDPRTLSKSWIGIAGAFWSSERGWLPYAPLAILALSGVGYTVRRYGRWALFGLAVAGAYLLAYTIAGAEPGFAFPGRYVIVLMPFAAIPLLLLVADLPAVRLLFWPLAAFTLYLAFAVVFEPPPSVAGVPGVTGPGYPQLMWPWFVNLWPAITPTAGHLYPDIAPVVAWSAALLALCLAGYFLLPRFARSTPAH